MTAIKLRFSTLDGIRKTKAFKSLKGARKAAHAWIGADADVGGHYAVSTDGVVKLTVEGCTLADIFGPEKDSDPTPENRGDGWYKIRIGGDFVAKTFQYRSDAEAYVYDNGLDDITFDRPDGSIGVVTVSIELYRTGADGKPELVPVERAAVANDEIPF